MGEHDAFNQPIVDEFRANQGQVGGPFQGARLLLLHHKGARSGVERVNPLAYRPDGQNLVIFGSMGGAPNNPDWFYNLQAHPDTTVEIGSETRRVRARVAHGEERERLFEAQKRDVPPFAKYETMTTREIPVIVLEPR